MSNVNLVPTAVVSPLVPSDTLMSLNSTSSKDNQLSSNNWNNTENLISKQNCSVSALHSMCSHKLDCQNSVKKSKLLSTSGNDSDFVNLSDCSVKLTNFQHDDYPVSFDPNVTAEKMHDSLPVQDDEKKAKTRNSSGFNEQGKPITLKKQNTRKRGKVVCHITNIKPAKRRKLKEIDVKPSLRVSAKARSKDDGKRKAADEKYVSVAENSPTPYQSSLYTPKKTDLLQRFSSNVTVCSLCHLPANFLPQLGDLFGPYRPSYTEVVDRYKDIQKQLSLPKEDLRNDVSVKSEEQISVDQQNSICYIKSPCLAENETSHDDEDTTSLSISGSRKIIHSLMPELKMYQTVDCILSEANKRPAAKFCRNSKSLRIPGFSGTIRSSDKSLPVYTDSNKTLLHDINTVVIVEPTKMLSRNENFSTGTNPGPSLPFNRTSVDVVHKFNINPIWLHSPCAVWTPGVYCVRNKVYGVTTAVREAADSVCTYCQRPGATISCKFKRNVVYHYLCCFAEGLTLDEDSFMAVS